MKDNEVIIQVDSSLFESLPVIKEKRAMSIRDCCVVTCNTGRTSLQFNGVKADEFNKRKNERMETVDEMPSKST